MNNENDLLEFANDMKEQYDKMKNNYDVKIAALQQENKFLRDELTNKAPMNYLDDMFKSPREPARFPTYVCLNKYGEEVLYVPDYY